MSDYPDDGVEDLDAFINAVTEEELAALGEPDELRDADVINRLLGYMSKIHRDMARDTATAEAEKARVDAWLKRRHQVSQDAYDRREKAATDWHAAILRLDPSRTFISLPNGELKAAKQQDEWLVDDDVFLAYSDTHGGFCRRVKYEVARDVLKKGSPPLWAISPMEFGIKNDDGDMIPGVTVVVRSDKKLTVKPRGA